MIMFLWEALRNMKYDCEKDKLSFYHKVCALLVPTKKRIRFPCNSIPMPPARYMLKHKMRKDIGYYDCLETTSGSLDLCVGFSPV